MDCPQRTNDCLIYNQCLVPHVNFRGVIASPPGGGGGRKADSHFTAEKTDSERSSLPRMPCWLLAELEWKPEPSDWSPGVPESPVTGLASFLKATLDSPLLESAPPRLTSPLCLSLPCDLRKWLTLSVSWAATGGCWKSELCQCAGYSGYSRCRSCPGQGPPCLGCCWVP